MRIAVLILIVAALGVLLIAAARLLERRVRSGPPAHQYEDHWMGDDD